MMKEIDDEIGERLKRGVKWVFEKEHHIEDSCCSYDFDCLAYYTELDNELKVGDYLSFGRKFTDMFITYTTFNVVEKLMIYHVHDC